MHLLKMFESILTDEDIVKKLAESREVSEKMIDMLEVLQKHEKAEVVPMKMFAKK